MSVERFKKQGLIGLIPADNGHWVRYSDYATLSAENAELRRKVEEAERDGCMDKVPCQRALNFAKAHTAETKARRAAEARLAARDAWLQTAIQHGTIGSRAWNAMKALDLQVVAAALKESTDAAE